MSPAQPHLRTSRATKPISPLTARSRRPQHRRRASRRNHGLGLVVLLILVVLGVVAWTHRPVEITVNDTRQSLTVGTPLTEVEQAADLGLKAGDHLSVTGEVLREGGGIPFQVSIDGKQLGWKKAQAYRIRGGEDITFSDGKNTTESYTATSEDIAPRLTSDGSYGAICYVSTWGKPGKLERREGKESGQTAEVVVSEAEDCLIKHVNIQPKDGKKYVALTFDDGPSTYTKKYLKALKDAGAKATFFCLGTQINNYPDEAKAIVDAGCQIASHTYNHPNLATSSAETILDEFTRTFAIIKDTTGVSTTVIRPPYGSMSTEVWLASQGTMSAYILWNVDTRDWASTATADSVYEAAIQAESGDIILMHDGGGKRDHDVEALPRIIKKLQDEGYEFVTIDELMALDPDIPEAIATGDAHMPKDALWPQQAA